MSLPDPAADPGLVTEKPSARRLNRTRPEAQWPALGPQDTGSPGYSAGTNGHDRYAKPTARRTLHVDDLAAAETQQRVRTPPPASSGWVQPDRGGLLCVCFGVGPEGKSGADDRDSPVEAQAPPHLLVLKRLGLIQAGGLDRHEGGGDQGEHGQCGVDPEC